MRIDNEAEQLSIYDLDLWCGRMFQEPSPAEPQKERISGSSSRRLSELKSVVFQSLDLTPGAGNLLGEFYWELISPWRGDASTLNTGVSPREEKESSLSQILQDDPPDKYYLTRKACLGILRRAFERGKELPRKLNRALEIQSGVAPPADTVHNQQPPHASQQDGCTEGFDGYNGDLTGSVAATLGVNCGMSTGRNGLIQPIAFAANQRDEVRDLHDVAGALGAQPGMKQQTFIAEGVVAKGNGDCFLTPERHTSLSAGGGQAGQGYPCVLTAGFSAGAGASAGSIGYGEELAPTLKGSASGNCMPSILYLNDQGGSVMECSLDITGTLRAQEHGHQPLVFDNHGQDTRFCGPVKSTQTVSATFGMGGNSVTIRGNEWYDHAEERGGHAVSFVQRFYHLSYPEAVTMLLGGELGTVYPSAEERVEDPPKPFVLPPANSNMRRVYAYLVKHRNIDRSVVAHFAREKLLYEDADYHNAVFVGTDEDGVPRHAHKRSANSFGKAFRLNVEGCDPRHSFHHIGTDGSLYVFEAPIDMLSYITLHPENWQSHSYVACCGTSIQPVLKLLERQPQINTVLLCLDNDEAGHLASRRMKEQLAERYTVERLIPAHKDWNDDLTAEEPSYAQVMQ